MTRLLRKVLHLGVIVAAVLQRAWESVERRFRPKTQTVFRSARRFDVLKRKEMELERLDRLRNPGDYRGR
jgi:hypothetical protein